jgi:predicted cobalt transporter CbtA
MWILKGTFLGLWLFGFGTIAFFYFAIFRHVPLGTEVPTTMVTGLTTQNPWWWVALVASIAIGCALVHSWPGKGSVVFWVVLFVTSVIPVGLFSLVAVMISKLKEAAKEVH